MPRRPRLSTGGIAYHVLNRRAGRLELFDKPADYSAFEKILGEAHHRTGIRIAAYCLIAKIGRSTARNNWGLKRQCTRAVVHSEGEKTPDPFPDAPGFEYLILVSSGFQAKVNNESLALTPPRGAQLSPSHGAARFL
jgi:hypothetical protein